MGFHEMGFRYFMRMIRECVEILDKRSYVFGKMLEWDIQCIVGFGKLDLREI